MPRKHRPSTATPEGQARKLHVFRHNSYLGFCTMGMANMRTVAQAPSTCPETRRQAEYIGRQLTELHNLLKLTRIDPPKEQDQ